MNIINAFNEYSNFPSWHFPSLKATTKTPQKTKQQQHQNKQANKQNNNKNKPQQQNRLSFCSRYKLRIASFGLLRVSCTIALYQLLFYLMIHSFASNERQAI